MKLHNEAARTRNPGNALPYLESAIAAREKGLNPYVYPMVDWKDMLFKDYTVNYRGNMSISGGGRVARYYVALSYSVFCFRCSSESAQDIYYHPRLFMSITIFHFFCFF